VQWNNVSGARAYIIYAAYSASTDPGTSIANYYAQYVQTTSAVLPGLLYRDALGTGVGTGTGYLSVDYENWVVSGGNQDAYIQANPISADRSAFFYLRGSDVTYHFNNPLADAYHIDASGNLSLSGHNLATPWPTTGAIRFPTNKSICWWGPDSSADDCITGTGTGGQDVIGPSVPWAIGAVNALPALPSGGSTYYNLFGLQVLQGTTVVAIGADNTAGYIQASASVPLVLNPAGNQVQTGPGGLKVGAGIANNGGGVKHIRGAVGCTTAASAGATCTSSAISWSTPFADSNYTLVCTLETPTGIPVVSSVSKSTGASFTMTIAALTAVGATGSYDCVGGHDN
jgi:hypothetical protein